MGAIEDLQRSLEGSTRASKTELVRWQAELQHSLESLCDCIKTYLDILLKQAEENPQKKERSAESESTSALLPRRLIMGAVKFIGSSVASGVIAAHYSAIFLLGKEGPEGCSSASVAQCSNIEAWWLCCNCDHEDFLARGNTCPDYSHSECRLCPPLTSGPSNG
jgi:hypothetical protein